MSSKRTARRMLLAAIPLCAALNACATPARPSIAPPPSDVSCALFKRISYALMPPGAVDDPGNVADSKETIAEITAHNRAWTAVCEAG